VIPGKSTFINKQKKKISPSRSMINIDWSVRGNEWKLEWGGSSPPPKERHSQHMKRSHNIIYLPFLL
jgi:hypothetical protein